MGLVALHARRTGVLPTVYQNDRDGTDGRPLPPAPVAHTSHDPESHVFEGLWAQSLEEPGLNEKQKCSPCSKKVPPTFTPLAAGALEPGGSERLSEPEADRHYLDGGSPYGLRYLLEDAYAQPDEEEEESEDGATALYATGGPPPPRQRSASEEALPQALAAFPHSLPSPPSEESGSLEESAFQPPLLPGPPRRPRPKKKFPEYKV